MLCAFFLSLSPSLSFWTLLSMLVGIEEQTAVKTPQKMCYLTVIANVLRFTHLSPSSLQKPLITPVCVSGRVCVCMCLCDCLCECVKERETCFPFRPGDSVPCGLHLIHMSYTATPWFCSYLLVDYLMTVVHILTSVLPLW